MCVQSDGFSAQAHFNSHSSPFNQDTCSHLRSCVNNSLDHYKSFKKIRKSEEWVAHGWMAWANLPSGWRMVSRRYFHCIYEAFPCHGQCCPDAQFNLICKTENKTLTRHLKKTTLKCAHAVLLLALLLIRVVYSTLYLILIVAAACNSASQHSK